MKSKCRNDLKRLSQERGGIRDPTSKTRLMTFAGFYPQAFDILWVEFAMCPSSTRMAEAFNGIEKWCWDPQTPRDWRDARGRYLTKKEYDNRRGRRIAIYNESMEKLKCAPKHNDRNLTVTMAGTQCNSNSCSYTRYALEKRTPESILRKYSPTETIKRGTMVEHKDHVEKVFEHAENKRKKKESSEGYERISMEEYQRRAEQNSSQTSYDVEWEYSRSPEAICKAKLKTLTTTTFWNGLKVSDGFHEEIKRVMPQYWRMVEKDWGGKGGKPSKKAIMSGKAPIKIGLAAYLEKALELAKSETTPSQAALKKVMDTNLAKQIRRAKSTGDELLMELILLKSISLRRLKEKSNKSQRSMQRCMQSWRILDPTIQMIECGRLKLQSSTRQQSLTVIHPSPVMTKMMKRIYLVLVAMVELMAVIQMQMNLRLVRWLIVVCVVFICLLLCVC